MQREVRALAARTFFAQELSPGMNMDRAYTMIVYSSCQPCYGRRPAEFTYDIGDLVTLSSVLRLIGRAMRARLAHIAARIQFDPKLRRRFLPVWHQDILQSVKYKPRPLIEMLAREAAMINALIELGTTPDERNQSRFLKATCAAARIIALDSDVLQDLVLRTSAESLLHRGIFEDRHPVSPGRPDARIGGDKNRDDGSSDGRRQMADAGIVSDIEACA